MLTLILKAITSCNLRCIYCSVGDKKHSARMDGPTMTVALEWFANYALKRGEKIVSVILHGGEPMLLPASQYRHCLQHIKNSFPQLEWDFSMQSNGTILSPEYIELIRDLDIGLGLSLDGGPKVHDSQRKNIRGQATYQTIMDNIDTLQANECYTGTIMVLTKPALHEDLSFLKELNKREVSLKINPLIAEGEAVDHPELSLSPGDYADYLIRVFKYVCEEKIDFCIDPLSSFLKAIIYDMPLTECSYSADSCGRFISIDPLGNIYHCGRFCDAQKYIIGNIWDGITEEGRRCQRQILAQRTSDLPEICRQCEVLSFCQGGCSAVSLLDQNQKLSYPLCQDYRKLVNFLRTEGLDILRSALVKEKEELQKLVVR